MPYTQFEYLNITLDLHPRITDKIESMADNYIERQYEQYEARKAAWEKARKYGKRKRGSLTLLELNNRAKRQQNPIIIKEYLLREEPMELVNPL